MSHLLLGRLALVRRALLVDDGVEFLDKSRVVAVQVVEERVAEVTSPGVKPLGEQVELALEDGVAAAVKA